MCRLAYLHMEILHAMAQCAILRYNKSCTLEFAHLREVGRLEGRGKSQQLIVSCPQAQPNSENFNEVVGLPRSLRRFFVCK